MRDRARAGAAVGMPPVPAVPWMMGRVRGRRLVARVRRAAGGGGAEGRRGALRVWVRARWRDRGWVVGGTEMRTTAWCGIRPAPAPLRLCRIATLT